MDDVKALGVSPPASPVPDGAKEVGPEQEQPATKDTQPPTKSAMLTAQRDWPFFTSMAGCFQELDLQKVTIETGGVNNCLLYSYSVASGEMQQQEQRSRCAVHRLCFRLHSLPARACACSESRTAVQSLRSEVHKKLCEKLASTGSVADMTVEKVRFAASAAGPRANSFLPALAG
jgi:hypothetical protein